MCPVQNVTYVSGRSSAVGRQTPATENIGPAGSENQFARFDPASPNHSQNPVTGIRQRRSGLAGEHRLTEWSRQVADVRHRLAVRERHAPLHDFQDALALILLDYPGQALGQSIGQNRGDSNRIDQGSNRDKG